VTAALSGANISISVLGPFHAVVDGRDLTDHLSVAQRSVLGLLAASRRPVAKSALCRVVGLSPKSIDPLLSKLRGPLGTDRPLHRSRTPGPGYVSLDPELVATDVDAFLAEVEAGERAQAAGADDEAVAHVLAADGRWRGRVLDGVDLIEAPGPASVAAMVADLEGARRRARTLAAWCWLGGARRGLGAERLRAWAEELRDDEACWSAATQAALERHGPHAAAAVLSRWRERASIEDDAAASGVYAQVALLLDGRRAGRPPVTAGIAEAMSRAEAAYLAGRWDDAERDYTAAAEEARAQGDPFAEAEVALVSARLTWDPSRYDGRLGERMDRLLGDLPADERLVRARLLACLAGGLYQDGSAGSPEAVAYARRALELVVELEDPLTEAEVLSHARKALVDVDPPEVQIERSRRILASARGSDYHRSLGLMAVIVDLALLAREAEARDETEAYREIAERTGSAFHRYHVAALDGMWALHDGRHDEVVRLTADAEQLGTGFGGIAVTQVVYAQRLWSAYETADHDTLLAMLPVVDAVAGVGTPVPVWELTGALIVAALHGTADEAGGDAEAVRRLTRVADATRDFRDVPQGPLRIAALAIGAIVASTLAARGHDVTRAAAGLRDQLVAHPAAGVLIGWPALYLGDKSRYVALATSATTAAA
jgi:hypothetical protein